MRSLLATLRGTGTGPALARLALLVALAAVLVFARGRQLLDDPEVSFLVDDGRSEWITYDRPFDLKSLFATKTRTHFRRSFETSEALPEADLTLRAMRRWSLHLDGERVASADPDADWKQPTTLRLPRLAPGEHVLGISVENDFGPPALAAHSEALGLRSGRDWSASNTGRRWIPARRADAPRRVDLFEPLPTAPAALASLAPWLLAVFALAFVWTRAARDAAPDATGALATPTPSQLRWGLVGAWIVLSVHNLPRIGPTVGLDVGGHVRYVEWIVAHGSLPLASDDWQSFQAPLFYLLSAPLLKLYSLFLEPAAAIQALRALPMACGIAQIEIAYRAARVVFPRRPALQRVALVVATLLPMHVYMSQSLSNEPLAAVFTALTILLVLRLLAPNAALAQPRECLWIGLAWGAAALAKTSAVLLAAPLLFAALWHVRATRAPLAQWLPRAALVPAAMLALCGAWYLRNWLVLGAPFVGGWDPARGFAWWQDPGYRTAAQLLAFGESLRQPILASTVGWWDALHATLWLDGNLSSELTREELPPWNLRPMIANALLGLIPAIAMLVGGGRALVAATARPVAPLAFAVACVVAYLAAMLDLFVRLPIYTTAKASYLLGLLPCFGLLAAAGFEPLLRSRTTTALGSAALACWAVSAFAAHWA